MPLVYPTGDIDVDLPKIYAHYRGVIPRHPAWCDSKTP